MYCKICWQARRETQLQQLAASESIQSHLCEHFANLLAEKQHSVVVDCTNHLAESFGVAPTDGVSNVEEQHITKMKISMPGRENRDIVAVFFDLLGGHFSALYLVAQEDFGLEISQAPGGKQVREKFPVPVPIGIAGSGP
ncbi:hypothetical protein DSO57_1011599 [Entomophthora muscae]|uniref:Uncharacterized protein n=1 Tax=Entomophthora muscae TaxID=34485 RepID=A0ACC2UFS9_9FUNG|nr:hypothetical protein DSO57_1011599 [Entomophthora muscae]